MGRQISLAICLSVIIAFVIPAWVGNLSINAEYQAAADQPEPTIDFDTEVMAIFTRYGCNAAQCHGAASGQNGFRLSLFGGDAEFDYRSIALEAKGRRVHPGKPSRSLVAQKATGGLDHYGGRLFELDSAAYRLLTTWIEQGARRTNQRTLADITPQLHPAATLQVGDQVTLTVLAKFHNSEVGYGDIDEIDVTQWAVIQPLDDSAVTYAQNGSQLIVQRPGTHYVLIRYLTATNLLQVNVPFQPPVGSDSWTTFNWIDTSVHQSWSQMGIQPPAIASDTTLVRRVYLTLTGRLPAPHETKQFVASDHPLKYETLIDELLSSSEFVDMWTAHLADWFQAGQGNNPQASIKFFNWIRQQVSEDRPMTEIAQAMLTASGDIQQNPAVGFYLGTTDPRRQAERMGQTWLSVRLRCAECHNHPLDRWTQDDYYALAAMFSKIDYKQPLQLRPAGSIVNPRTGQAALPRIETIEVPSAHDDPRQMLATWLIDSNNPYFGTTVVNRLLGWVMGRAFFEPIDDFRRTNPIIQTELLDLMVEKFQQGEYRIRPLIRDMLLSATWRRSTSLDANAPQSAALLRFNEHRLSALVLLDSICDVTGTPLHPQTELNSQPKGLHQNGLHQADRAIRLALPQTDRSVQVFGGCPRDGSAQPINRESVVTVASALDLLNGEWINERLRHPNGRLALWLAEGATDRQMLDDIYWLAYSRPPRAAELEHWLQVLAEAKHEQDRNAIWQDLMWSILVSREFVTNH